MKPLALFVIGVATYSQDVRFHGRVYESGHPNQGIAGVSVVLKSGGQTTRKLTGRDGTYAFDSAKRGQANVTFSKAGWQPNPRGEELTLLTADVLLEIDLFQPVSAKIKDVAEWKTSVVNLESRKSSTSGHAIFVSEWRSCEEAKIPVRDRVTCAQVLNKDVASGVGRPETLLRWVTIDPTKLGDLEGKVSDKTVWTLQEGDFQALGRSGIPPQIIFDQVVFELDKSAVGDTLKQAVEAKARSGLRLSFDDATTAIGVGKAATDAPKNAKAK